MQNLYPILEPWQDESTISLKHFTSTPEDKKEPIIHTVSEYDTLDGISIKYNVSKDAIRLANGFSGDFIYTFKTLKIPFSKGQIYYSNEKFDPEDIRKREYPITTKC